MSDSKPSDSKPSDGEESSEPPRHITDPQTMRALAHPVRLELLEVIQREGELTATRAAELLGESPGNMSWHLQTLAKYGFVEEAGGGKGRSRPWRLVASSNRFTARTDEPGAAGAGAALATMVGERGFEQLRQWFAARSEYSDDWQTAAFLNNFTTYLTADEMRAVCEELIAVVTRYDDRIEKRNRPEGALPVHISAFGHPLRPTDSGN